MHCTYFQLAHSKSVLFLNLNWLTVIFLFYVPFWNRGQQQSQGLDLETYGPTCDTIGFVAPLIWDNTCMLSIPTLHKLILVFILFFHFSYSPNLLLHYCSIFTLHFYFSFLITWPLSHADCSNYSFCLICYTPQSERECFGTLR